MLNFRVRPRNTTPGSSPAISPKKQVDAISWGGSFWLLVAKRGEQEAKVARELYDWVCARGWRPWFGAGKQDGSWIPIFEASGQEYYPIALYSYGRIELQFQYLKARPPFDDEQTRLELLRRVNEIPGVFFETDVITRRPSIPLSLLVGDPAAMAQLRGVLEWTETTANTAR